MVLAKTSLTADSLKSFVIDAGTIWKNFTYNQTDGFKGDSLGATNGGVSVEINNTTRDIQVDSAYVVATKGLKVVSKMSAQITANIKELTLENLRLSIHGHARNATATEAPEGYQVIENFRNIEDEDYIENVAVVGVLSGTEKPVVFMLDNGFVTSALKLDMKDNGEAETAVTIEATASLEQLQNGEFPWRILFPPMLPTTKAS